MPRQVYFENDFNSSIFSDPTVPYTMGDRVEKYVACRVRLVCP